MSETQNAPDVRCPKCKSDQIFAGKKGFSGRKAVGGAILTGGIGLLAGTLGSNKIKITCLACGNVFSPGDALAQQKVVKLNEDKAALKRLHAIHGLFIQDYQVAKDKDAAFERLKEKDPTASKYANGAIAFNSLKSEQTTRTVGGIIFAVIIIFVILYLAVG